MSLANGLNFLIMHDNREIETRRQGKLILVVDDDPDLVEAIAMKLESENYRVAKAYDGMETWDKIKRNSPH